MSASWHWLDLGNGVYNLLWNFTSRHHCDAEQTWNLNTHRICAILNARTVVRPVEDELLGSHCLGWHIHRVAVIPAVDFVVDVIVTSQFVCKIVGSSKNKKLWLIELSRVKFAV